MGIALSAPKSVVGDDDLNIQVGLLVKNGLVAQDVFFDNPIFFCLAILVGGVGNRQFGDLVEQVDGLTEP